MAKINPSHQTPGVYIVEKNAFPNSVVAVSTAVPAFIGYTPNASYQGKSYTNVPVKISSFADFRAFYCLPDLPAPAPPAKPYQPQYYWVKQSSQPTKGTYLLINGAYYALLPDPNTIYYLYNSVRLFYQNGGRDAYIVSVGAYGAPSGKPMNVGEQIVNPNVRLDALINGLNKLLREQEPTMYICPEATLLSVADNGKLMQAMLTQAAQMQTAMCIFDLIGGNTPDPIGYTNDIQTFRDQVGTQGLSYGAAYYPFIGTNILQTADLDYTNLFGGDIKPLVPLLNPPNQPNAAAASILTNIQNAVSTLTVAQNHTALTFTSPLYANMMQLVLTQANLLPPSGAIAGIITMTDNNYGVWKAPANVSIASAVSLPIQLSDNQQADLNVDSVSGKSICAIRMFTGKGILVWGARTLDGNNLEWRYVSVRRTVTFIEQSCKLATRAYVFEPNDANAWATVTAMLSNFLYNLWKQGGLQGAKPENAFVVRCGLGTTMTANDILNGYMIVTIMVALVRPAEFIVFSFQQQMGK